MPRYKLTLEYDGSYFCGWQVQDSQPSVQGTLQEAIKRFCGEEVVVTGAGRTDAGVHATGQVAHMDLAHTHDPFRILMALNAHLRDLGVAPLQACISVLEVVEVADDFHARFCALKRHYTYRILNRRAPSALNYRRVWHIAPELDAKAMHDAGQLLTGTHDFTSFRDSQCQAKSPIKSIDDLRVTQHGEYIECHIAARSFLHHQVRIIMGSLAYVGQGRWNALELEQALIARNRADAGPTAPAHGLYLTKVEYG